MDDVVIIGVGMTPFGKWPEKGIKGLVAEAVTEAGVELIRPDLKPWMDLAEPMVRGSEGKMWEPGLYDKIKALK